MQNAAKQLEVQPESPSLALTPEQVAEFETQGYIKPFKVYEPEEMKTLWRRERLRLIDRTHAVYQEEAAKSGNTNIGNYDRHLDSSFLADHICRREIVDRLVNILGPDILCWRTEFFPKYPGDEGTDWHQADTFANASGTPQIIWPESMKKFGGTITVWTAFTEATEDTACLQFIPGSHLAMNYDETKRMTYEPDRINKERKEGVARGFFGYDYRALQVDPDWKPDESKAVSMVMKPGEAVIFSSTLMHASHPHRGKTDLTLARSSSAEQDYPHPSSSPVAAARLAQRDPGTSSPPGPSAWKSSLRSSAAMRRSGARWTCGSGASNSSRPDSTMGLVLISHTWMRPLATA